MTPGIGYPAKRPLSQPVLGETESRGAGAAEGIKYVTQWPVIDQLVRQHLREKLEGSR